MIAALALIASGFAAFAAQYTIKVNVETVQVYANVTDLKGRFVTGLNPSDFRVFEDGKEQKIDGFTFDDSPVSVGILIDANGSMCRQFCVGKARGARIFKGRKFAE